MIKVIPLEMGSINIITADDNIVLSKVIDIDNDLYAFAAGTPVGTGNRYVMIRYIQYEKETSTISVSVVTRTNESHSASMIEIAVVFIRKFVAI